MICDFERSPSHTQSGRHGAAAPVRAIQIMGKKRDEYISRTLVRLLRYAASNFGLAQDADGFCSVHELLKLEEFESVYSFAAEMLRIATSSIGKYGPRFEMRGDLFVRAALRRARGDRRTTESRTKHRRSPESRKNHGSLRGKRKPRGGKGAADGGKWAVRTVASGRWRTVASGRWSRCSMILSFLASCCLARPPGRSRDFGEVPCGLEGRNRVYSNAVLAI